MIIVHCVNGGCLLVLLILLINNTFIVFIINNMNKQFFRKVSCPKWDKNIVNMIY